MITPMFLESIKKITDYEAVIKANVKDIEVLKTAKEMGFAGDYDFVVVNDDLDKAVEDFRAVVRAIELKNIK